MSINSLADKALNRGAGLGKFRTISLPTDSATADDLETAGNAGPGNKDAGDALNKLVQYIPTESVTLYVAAMAAAPAITQTWQRITVKQIYWFFGLFTPVLLLLILMGKRKAQGQPPLPRLPEWPWWELSAAFAAFLVWALAVPGGPYMLGPTQGVVAGFLAVFISAVLPVI